MDEDDSRGMTKSYKLGDLEPIEPPAEEVSRFKEGDRVLIIKDPRDSSMKGKSAIVTDPSSTGLVQVRVEEEDSMKGMLRSYKPECLEIDCSEADPNRKLVDGIDTLGTANVNVQVIGQMLHDHGIETSKWGTGQAKPLKSLAQEVQNGTSQLMLDATQHRNNYQHPLGISTSTWSLDLDSCACGEHRALENMLHLERRDQASRRSLRAIPRRLE